MSKTPSDEALLTLVKTLVRALDDKKAEQLRVLDVSAKSTITDYLVLANGNSDPHLRALRIEAEKVLDAAKQPIAGMDSGNYGAGWTVIDAYQIMTHLFTAEQRENYALEKLWKDAVQLDVKALLQLEVVPDAPASPKKRKVAAKKVAKAQAKPRAKVAARPKSAAVKTVKKVAAAKKTVSARTVRTPASKKKA